MIFDLDDALLRSYEKLLNKFMISDVFERLAKPEYDITNDATYTRVKKRQLQRMGKLGMLRKFEGHWQKTIVLCRNGLMRGLKKKILNENLLSDLIYGLYGF